MYAYLYIPIIIIIIIWMDGKLRYSFLVTKQEFSNAIILMVGEDVTT